MSEFNIEKWIEKNTVNIDGWEVLETSEVEELFEGNILVDIKDLENLSEFITKTTYITSLTELKKLIYESGRDVIRIQEKYGVE